MNKVNLSKAVQQLQAEQRAAHGHLHHAPPTDTPHINVSVEQLGYAPVRDLQTIVFSCGPLH